MNLRLQQLSIAALALSGWLIAAPQTGKTTDTARAADDAAAQDPPSITFARGSEIPVGSAREPQPEEAKTVFVDSYLDWDYGTLTYVGENGSIAAVPIQNNWEFRHVQLPRTERGGGGMVALCFQPGLGTSFLLDGDGNWKAIEEPSPTVVMGNYDVTLAIDSNRIFAVRFDRHSGRSWTLEDTGWNPITGNIQGWPEAGTK